MCGDIGSVTKLHRMRVPGVEDYRGDGGLAIAARAGAEDLTIDNEGNLFIAEFGNSRIRRINAKRGSSRLLQEMAFLTPFTHRC
jgi:hypothetical protein